MRCCSGKHFWLHDIDAKKCCNPKYKRVYVPMGEEIPSYAEITGRKRGIFGTYVWIPAPSSIQFILDAEKINEN